MENKTEDIKIVALAAVHGTDRDDVTIAMIHSLQKQTIPIRDIVIVGDRKENEELMRQKNCIYIHHANKPLSKKYQAGIDLIKTLNPDYVLIMGSDDLLSPLYCERMLSQYKGGMIGTKSWYVGRRDGGKYEIYKLKYTNRKDSIGAGRIYDKACMDKIGWNLYRDKRDKSLDALATSTIKKVGETISSLDIKDAICLGPKGNWKMINSWDGYLKRNKHLIQRKIENPEVWLEEHFPESKKELDLLFNRRKEKVKSPSSIKQKRFNQKYFFDWEQVEIVSVNHGTLDITPLHLSVRKHISKSMQFRVIDSGSTPKTIKVLKRIDIRDPYFSVEHFTEEIGHGKGMDHAIKSSEFPFLLFLDSRSKILQKGLLEFLAKIIKNKNAFYGVGRIKYVDENGSITGVEKGFPYLDPYCVLIKKEEYLQYPPFSSHEIPCIEAMKQLIKREQLSKLKNIEGRSMWTRYMKGVD